MKDYKFQKDFTSFAKINLGLKVLYRYPNGYHHIVSPVANISFADWVSFRCNYLFSSEESDKNSKTFTGNFSKPLINFSWKNHLPNAYREKQELLQAFLPQNQEKNLLHKSVVFLKNLFQSKNFQQEFLKFSKSALKIINHSILDFYLEKRIPSPCGLGGGSSNAATALKFLTQAIFYYLEEEITESTKKEITKKIFQHAVFLGADVPLFLKEKNSCIDGIGETIDFSLPASFMGILAIPDFSFSTKEMYSKLKKPLQDEYVFTNSQADVTRCYHDFFESFSELGNGFNFKEAFKEIAEVIRYKDSEIFLLKNDFLTVAQTLDCFKNESSFLLKQLKELGKEIEILDKTPLVSMSGSGSAFYALFFLNKQEQNDLNQRKQIEKKLQATVKKLTEENSSLYYKEFFSVH